MPLLDASLVDEPHPRPLADDLPGSVLILGVGNVLMGDEGVGVHAIRLLEKAPSIPGVRLLDGGTGGINLLAEFDVAHAVILIDATRDGHAAGTVTHLLPKRGSELPRGLGAHDFGLKDLFAACALLGRLPELHVYAVSISTIRPMTTTLSAPVAATLPVLLHAVHAHAGSLAAKVSRPADAAPPPTVARTLATDAQPAGR